MWNTKESYPGSELGIEWKERCIEDGVPPEIFELKPAKKGQLPKAVEVYATRVAGAGSQVAQLIGLQELQSISGSFGPREEKAYKRQLIIAAAGPESLEEFDQDSDNADEQAGGASLAGVENAIIQAGKSPIFSKDNDQRSHAAVHIALASQTIQAMQQQQMDPIQADSVFSVLVPHLSEHMAALEQNPFTQGEFSKLRNPYEQIAKYAALNRKNAAKMVQAQQKQQQAQQQTMSEEQLKNYTTMQEEKRKDVKLQRQDARQQEQHQVKKQMLEEKTASDIELNRMKATGDISTKRMTAKAKIGLENNATERATENPSAYIEEINGTTPAPYDIEGINPASRTY